MSVSGPSAPITVLLVSHFYSTHRGGIEIVAGTLAKFLASTGDVTVRWMASDVTPASEGVDGLKCIPARACNIVEDKLQLPYPLWSLPSLVRLWKEVRAADVVHVHDYLYMGNMAAFLFAKLCGKPVVVTQHIGFIPYDSALLRSILSILNRTLGSLVLGQADRTVFISEGVQAYFNRQTWFRTPAMLIPNGVDTEVYIPIEPSKRELVRQDLDLPKDKPIFLFVGRFVEKKGLSILKDVAQRFPSVSWLFAGWGPLDPDTWDMPNVRVFRDRRGPQLTPLYQVADLLVLPSKGEGFPLVVQEAMACGTPAMVSPETASAYSAARPLILVADVETDAVSTWSDRLTTILQDRDRMLADLRLQVASFAREHWSWQGCADRYVNLFQSLISPSSS
ncbi:MAG: glycosyltransferase family 4 protein [Synechococcus sp.]